MTPSDHRLAAMCELAQHLRCAVEAIERAGETGVEPEDRNTARALRAILAAADSDVRRALRLVEAGA